MTLSADEKNAFLALKTAFKLKKVRVTSTTLRNQLLQEPTFPSLMSLSSVLTNFNVHNIPVVIKPEQLSKIPLPAIAHFANGMGYATVIKVKNNQVQYYHDEFGALNESMSEFTQKWQGLILIVKPDESIRENNFEHKFRLDIVRKLRMPFVYISTIFALGYFILNSSNNTPSQYAENFYRILFIKIIGLISSIFLVRLNITADRFIFENTTILDKLKNSFVKGLTLESRKIDGWLNWSEIGLVYFVVGLYILFSLANGNNIAFLKWFNLMTIPYIVWAVYYQIFVIKEWCLICLGAILLLGAEFYSFMNVPLFVEQCDFSPVYTALINSLLITAAWVFIGQHLANSISNEGLYYSLQRTKFGSNFVRSTFNIKQTIPPFFGEMQTVLIGSAEAEHKLLAVLNLNSDLCAIRFDELVSLSDSNEKISCKVILVPDSLEDVTGIRGIKKILNHTDEQRFDALTNWFKHAVSKHIKCSDTAISEEKLDTAIRESLSWAFLARISLTNPTIYLNNNVLPSIYDIKEIPMLFRILSSK